MTIHDLSESGEFQGLFQFQFEEAVNTGRKGRLDVNFSKPATFSFTSDQGNEHHGRFTGEVETFGDDDGETAGTVHLMLPTGWESRRSNDVLEGAELTVQIERFPSSDRV